MLSFFYKEKTIAITITREMRSHGGVRENSEILSFEVEFQILQNQSIENTQQISSIS